MLQVSVQGQPVFTLSPDGSISLSGELTVEDAARAWWPTLLPAWANYTEDCLEQVSVTVDGQQLAFKNWYVPSPEAMAFWNAVRAAAPFVRKEFPTG